MITTTSELRSHWPSCPAATAPCEAPTAPPNAASDEPDDEGDRERELDVDAERGGHLPVIDAGPDHHAGACAVEPDPEAESDGKAEEQHDQARQRVVDPEQRQLDEPVRPARPRHARGDAFVEVRENLVGDDHRDGDRDQRLPKLLTLVPAQEHLLHNEPHEPDRRGRDERREDPLPGIDLDTGDRVPRARHLLLHLVGDVAAEEVERAVRHVDDAHQSEDEREAACHDEQKPGKGEPVEQRAREALPVVDRGAERRRAPVAADVGRRVREHDDVQQGEPHEQADDELRSKPADVELCDSVAQDDTNLTTRRDRYNREPAIIDSFR